MAALFSTAGRLAPNAFVLGAAGVYATGIVAQVLLSAEVLARAGVWPFIVVQAVLIWLWLLLHIRRLRDAGEGPDPAIGVAVVYALSLALQLTLIAFLTSPDAGAVVEEAPSGAGSRPPALSLIAILFNPDIGTFTTILKGLIVIAFLPAGISLIFSIRTGLRRTVS